VSVWRVLFPVEKGCGESEKPFGEYRVWVVRVEGLTRLNTLNYNQERTFLKKGLMVNEEEFVHGGSFSKPSAVSL